MKYPNLVKIALVLSALWIGTGAAAQSIEQAKSYCPTHEEWASTLKGDTKQLFWLFAMRAFTTLTMDRIADETDPELVDDEYERLLWLVGIHSFRGVDLDWELRKRILLLQGKPGVTDHYDEAVLEEIELCISGNTKADCAEMAFGKGYIPGLEDVVRQETISKYFDNFRVFCELPPRSGDEDLK